MAVRTVGAAAAAGLLLGVLAGCRIEHVDARQAAASAPVAGSFESKTFDPKAEVARLWDAKVLPEAQRRAGEFGALRQSMQQSLDAAGQAHGYRERSEGTPWNMFTRAQGRIVDADTTVSAATIGIDTDGDGKADLRVQIGPVVRGTAIRDALSFVSFTNYTNQVDFAQLASALNRRAIESAMQGVERDALQGKEVTVLGVFTTDDATQPVVLTPLQLQLKAPP